MSGWIETLLRDAAVGLGLPVRRTARRIAGPLRLYHGSPFFFDRPDPALFDTDPHRAAESPGFIAQGGLEAATRAARVMRPQGLPAYVYELTIDSLSGWLEPGLAIGPRRFRRLAEICRLDGARIDAILAESGAQSDGPRLYRRFVAAVGAPRASRLFAEAGVPGLVECEETADGPVVARAIFFHAGAVPTLTRSQIDPPLLPPVRQPSAAAYLAVLVASPVRRLAAGTDPAYQAATHEMLADAGLSADSAATGALLRRAVVGWQSPDAAPPLVLPRDAAGLARLQADDDQGPVAGGITRSVRLMRDPGSGRRLVVKTGRNPGALREEFLANRLYHALGVRVPDAALIETAAGPVMAMEFVSGQTMDQAMRTSDLLTAARLRQAVAADFAVDALLGNYDAGSRHDLNIIVTAAGDCVRIDQGAALRYNALGTLKPTRPIERLYRWGSPWNKNADCFDFLREPRWLNTRAVANYARLTDGEILGRLRRVADDFAAVEAIAPPALSAVLKRRLVRAIARFEEGERLHRPGPPQRPGLGRP